VHEIIQHTLRKTTQSAKSLIHHHLRRHLISRFQMLRHQILNEVIVADTYFASKSLLRGINVYWFSVA
jgi:hypothetical protein